MWFVYILECSDESLYTGITNNIEKRLQDHRDNKGAKYMRGRSPFTLVYCEAFYNRSEASKREAKVKSLKRSQKLKLIEGKKDYASK